MQTRTRIYTQTPIIYDEPYSISNDKLIYGPDNKTCDYVINKNTIQFLNEGIEYNIKIRGKDYIIDGNTVLFASYFDKPLDLFHDIPPNITVLIFGSYFSNEIVLTKHIVRLTFKGFFNQPIVLTSKIMYLTFRDGFD